MKKEGQARTLIDCFTHLVRTSVFVEITSFVQKDVMFNFFLSFSFDVNIENIFKR